MTDPDSFTSDSRPDAGRRHGTLGRKATSANSIARLSRATEASMLLLFFIAFTFLTLIPASCLGWGATLVNAAMYLRSYSDS